MDRFRIVIMEDNLLMRNSLLGVLELEEQLEVVADFENAADITSIYETYLPDLFIMDIDMPLVNGLEGLEQLKLLFPDTKVIMLTVFEDNDNVLAAICLGANGYILKSSPPEKIIEAIQEVMKGGAPLTPSIARIILQHFPKKQAQNKAAIDYNLSEKEMEVLQLLVQGFSYKMIASNLDKSIETIRVQIKSIYRKLQVQSNSEAILKALRYRIVPY